MPPTARCPWLTNVLDGAGDILTALCAGGPARGIAGYPPRRRPSSGTSPLPLPAAWAARGERGRQCTSTRILGQWLTDV